MTDQKKPTEPTARQRASQNEVAEFERALGHGGRSANAESDLTKAQRRPPADKPRQRG